ncbi:hypothetical protein IW261DRAFT_1522674 [Armillaria novae-zelandiae]|uniref:F-box domain-containing protein n=1 Tax=Armillaria novae-zelandiae TaxID=153914 RepID=A0AA39TX31_9AGAR|nr:hypothetical protein IW261DRAFT_1522674 [Armillaria novae-zelandiae]
MRLSFWRSPIRNSPLVTSLLIATVCSYWRSICLSLPQLWSIMFVDADEIFTSIISRKGILQANNYWDFSASLAKISGYHWHG